MGIRMTMSLSACIDDEQICLSSETCIFIRDNLDTRECFSRARGRQREMQQARRDGRMEGAIFR